jgi:hypothetical protein
VYDLIDSHPWKDMKKHEWTRLTKEQQLKDSWQWKFRGFELLGDAPSW